ncbi:MAG: hypothetical protein ACK4ND_09460 [Cytophagaceae bacterium]
MESNFSNPIISSVVKGMLFPVLVIPGLIIMQETVFFGSLLILIYFSLFTLKKGASIDFNNHKINFYSSYFGIKSNDWKEIKSFSNYKITNINKSYEMTARGVAPSVVTYRKTALDLFDKKERLYRRAALGEFQEIKEIIGRLKEYGIESAKKSGNRANNA